MKLISWNVNGIRACVKKGLLPFMEREKADVYSFQETKIQEKQLTLDLINPMAYHSVWDFAQRPGYSGVVTYSKEKPVQEKIGLGVEGYDHEGRIVATEFKDFILLNVYVPNGGMGDHRVKFKMDYYDHMLDVLERYRKAGKNVVITGDFNTAHTEIDLARPQENVNVSGFLPIERAWMDKFVSHGYVDVFRHFNPDVRDAYTWWSFRTAARKRNVGWRIDYFFVNKEFLSSVKSARILADVEGSDHCPVELVLAL